MNISKLKISEKNLDKIVNYLAQALPFDYENHSNDMSIISVEEYYFRNNSTQLNMVILKKEKSTVLIDIIGAAGGSGIFNISFWSESDYISRVRKVLNQYAEENRLSIEELPKN